MDTSAIPSELMTGQHRRIDHGIHGIVDGSGQLEALAASLALLRLHVYVEEELLFPPLAAAGLTMPVFVMKREHGQMWPLLETLATGCASSAPVESLREPARQLFQLLQMHNPKEEQIVYTAADRLVVGASDGTLAARLDAVHVPDDWICAMAPH